MRSEDAKGQTLEDFLPKVLFVQKKVVPLHRQYPPRFPKTSEPGRVVYL
jgi:hypothetical protein